MDIQSIQQGGEERSYVVAGAVLKCSFGDSKGRLKMPFSHGVYIGEKAQMNIMDYKPFINITPFGMCSSLTNPTVAAATAANNGVLKKMPCMPVVTMPWMYGKNESLIENMPALLNISTNICMYCGSITIEDDGQLL